MARAPALTGLFLAVATALWAVTAAQSSCGSSLTTLFPCLSYVRGMYPSPSPDCCTALSSIVKSQVECLCPLLSSSASKEDKDRALALPNLCSIEAPSPTDLCNGTAPVPPVSTKSPPSPPAPAPPPPTLRVAGGSSGGSSNSMTMGAVISVVFFTAASSIFAL